MKVFNFRTLSLSLGCLTMLMLSGCAAKKSIKLVNEAHPNIWTVETDASTLKDGDRYAVIVNDCKKSKAHGRSAPRKICKKRDVVGLTIKEVLNQKSAIIKLDRQINLGKSLEIEKR